jgi:hypothetical protein
MSSQYLHDLQKGMPDVPGFIAYHGNSQNDYLAMLLRLQLRDGYVEGIPQSILDALHNLPSIFEASGFAQQQSDTQGADNHSVI